MYRSRPPAKPFFLFILLFCISFAFIYSNSRVAFSRPGMLIRTPSLLTAEDTNEYSVGFSSEIINLSTFNSSDAMYFQGTSEAGLQYGVAYSSHVKTTKQDQNPPSDLSFHVSRKIYEMQKMQINMGINDILYSTEDKHELSLYISLLNSDIPIGKQERFSLQTALGFGTGKINYDSHNHKDGLSHRARFFFGLNFSTPYLANKGGMNLLFDFDGSGTHLGAVVPINKQLTIKLAMTNFQNIGEINKTYTNTEDGLKTIFSDAFALSIGLGFKLKGYAKTPPRVASQKVKFTASPNDCIVIHSRNEDNHPLSLDGRCEDLALGEFITNINEDFTTLNDSIKTINQSNLNYNHSNIAKDFEIKTLQDSINMQYLKQRISKSELNITMKHISQSLQYYYIGNYKLALEEIEQAIKRFPNLALAYARKGSIYYQMGDFQQATINWNLALKHDPEYAEVREMLSSIKTEMDKISSNNN